MVVTGSRHCESRKESRHRVEVVRAKRSKITKRGEDGRKSEVRREDLYRGADHLGWGHASAGEAPSGWPEAGIYTSGTFERPYFAV